MQVARLRVYPIKSCGGIDVQHAEVGIDGLALDHQFALVGANGKVLTMREYPKLALVEVRFGRSENTLEIDIPKIAKLPLYYDEPGGKPRPMQIHDDHCVGFDLPGALSVAFSTYLGPPAYLVRYMPGRHQRMHDSSALGRKIPCNFADGYPILVTNTGSIDLFEMRSNSRLAVERFRPQIVIACGDAGAEDEWRAIAANSVRLEFAKRCQRCQIPLIDPASGEKNPDILRAGMGHYTIPGKTGWFFASNYIPVSTGTIRVGESVEVAA